MAINTSIIFIIFNRPRHTKLVFESIKKQRPKKLFIIADGPRNTHLGEDILCEQARKITSQIDWDCSVYRNYSDINLGCKNRIVTGLNWAFSLTDEAIILEDDCLPHDDFYTFCQLLIEKYRDTEDIFSISGSNFHDGMKFSSASYYFSKYAACWGWATWARAWKFYDPSLSFWPEYSSSKEWEMVMQNLEERKYWEPLINQTYNNQIDTWDYQWSVSIWKKNGINITPNVNLVSNIGFGPDATHTITETDMPGRSTHPIGELILNDNIQINSQADMKTFTSFFKSPVE